MFEDIYDHNQDYVATLKRLKTEQEETSDVPKRYADRVVLEDNAKADGWAILKKMEWMLEKFSERGYSLSEQQREFWREFVITILPVIFDKHSLAENLEELRKIYHFDDYCKVCLILAPRKIGKTFFSTIFLTILAWAMPKCTGAIFSTSERASTNALKHCSDFLKVIEDVEGKKLWRSEIKTKTLQFTNAWGGLSIINAFPASTDTVRGVTGDWAFVDELAFVKKKFLNEVVIPLLTKCPILAITTRNGEVGNYVSSLIESNDTDEPFMKLISKMMACEVCIDKGKPDECEHMMAILPEWQNPQAIKHIKRILAADSNTFLRETLGIDGMEAEKCFNKAMVMSLQDFNRIEFCNTPSYILLAVDPAAGGIGSKFAVVSSYVQDDRVVILGIDCERIFGSEGNRRFLINHIERIRKIQWNNEFVFRDIPIVFCPESNFAYEHEHLNNQVHSIPELKPLRSYTNEKGEFGFRTDNNTKENGVDEINIYLNEKRIFFSEFFFTSSRKPDGGSLTPSEMVQEFCQQLCGFESRWENGDYEKNRRPKKRYSGKGSKMFDDLVMAMIINLLAHRRCRADKFINLPVKKGKHTVGLLGF